MAYYDGSVFIELKSIAHKLNEELRREKTFKIEYFCERCELKNVDTPISKEKMLFEIDKEYNDLKNKINNLNL